MKSIHIDSGNLRLKISKIIDQFNQPAKLCSLKQLIKKCLFLFITTSLFLVIYKPFGNTMTVGDGSWEFSVLVSLLISTLYFLIEDALILCYNNTNLSQYFTKGHYMIFGLLESFIIAFIIFLIQNQGSINPERDILSIFELFIKIILLGIISSLVISIYVLLKVVRSTALRNYFNSKVSKELPKEFFGNGELIVLKSVNNIFQVKIEDLHYIKSVENYVEVHFKENNIGKKYLLRCSLKNIENQLKHTSLIRCHRSCIVNLQHIAKMKGNSQGIILKIKGTNEHLAVSRSYVPSFKKSFMQFFENDHEMM